MSDDAACESTLTCEAVEVDSCWTVICTVG